MNNFAGKIRNLSIAHSIAIVLVVGIATMSGCFSISRYEANVHPDKIKPSSAVSRQYRLARVLINGADVVAWGDNEEAYLTGRWVMHEKENFGDKHKQEYELLRNHYINEEMNKNDWAGQMRAMEDPQKFMKFAGEFAKKYPEIQTVVARRARAYQEAEEIGDSEQKMECITNMVVQYIGWEAVRESADRWKKNFETQTNLSLLGYENMRVYFEEGFRSEFRAAVRYGKNKACAELYFDAVQSALLKNYPGVFTTASDAIPLTVLITFQNKYENFHNYADIFYVLGVPMTQEVEVEYNIRVFLDADGIDEEGLWTEYADSQFAWPRSLQNGGAVRRRERWTSMVLPISLIGIPGESDWPKERKWFTGKGIISKEEEASSSKVSKPREHLEKFVFDPVCDGDVIAALIMRSLNKMVEAD